MREGNAVLLEGRKVRRAKGEGAAEGSEARRCHGAGRVISPVQEVRQRQEVAVQRKRCRGEVGTLLPGMAGREGVWWCLHGAGERMVGAVVPEVAGVVRQQWQPGVVQAEEGAKAKAESPPSSSSSSPPPRVEGRISLPPPRQRVCSEER